MNVLRVEKPALLGQLVPGVSMVVEASAGTGKTYTIEHWVVDLLLADVPIERILVVTFTVKAAAELRERVRALLRLFVGATGERPKQAPEGALSWVIDDEARRKLERALSSFDAATIATIHAFCQGILTETGFLAGRLLNEERVSTRSIAIPLLRDLFRREILPHPELGPLFLEVTKGGATEAFELLVLRTMGLGRTIVPSFDENEIRRRIRAFREVVPADEAALKAYLKAEGIKGSSVNTAAGRLLELHAALGPVLENPWTVGTLHGIAKNDSLLTTAYERLRPTPGSPGAMVRDAIVGLIDALVSSSSALLQAVIPKLRQRLDADKRAKGVLDFDDMLTAVNDALDGPEGPAIVERLRDRYRVALIDEFQDTDAVQWSIFRRVFVESPGPNPAYLIGDPKQAIYSFRGADVGTYLEAKALLTKRAPALSLSECFRATPRLIEAYNTIFREPGIGLPGFFGASGIRYDAPVKAGRKGRRLVDAEGRDVSPVVSFDVDENVSSSDADLRALAQATAAEIRRITTGAPSLFFGEGDTFAPVRPKDIQILVRSKNQAKEVGIALREAGVAHTFYKQQGLFASEEAAELLDVLRAIADPADEASRGKAWLTRFFAVPLGELEEVRAGAADHRKVATLERLHVLGRERRYEELFTELLRKTGVVRREVALGQGERGLTNFLHMAEILLEEAQRRRGTLLDLVDFLRDRQLTAAEETLAEDEQRLESDAAAVQVLTMHVSKGLEAAIVFLVGAFRSGRGGSDGANVVHRDGKRAVAVNPLDPDLAELAKTERTEEERRLLYVALTRAKGRLYLPRFSSASKGILESYQGVQDGIVALDAMEDEAGPLLTRVTLEGGRPDSSRPSSRPPAPSALASFVFPRELDAPLEPVADLGGLVPRHEAPALASYTSLKRLGQTHAAPLASEEIRLADEAEPVPLPAKDELPAGREAGIFLHAVLEELPLDPVIAEEPFETWLARPEPALIVAKALERHRLEAHVLPHALRLSHAALTAPLALVGGAVLPGLPRATRILRETEIIYPIPEDGPTLPPSPGRDELVVRRGYVRGILDVVFEAEGRVYFADWKTDRLPRWEAAAVARHVADAYGLQAKLYTLGILRWLRITDEAAYEARFGGYHYVFVRGLLVAKDAAVAFDRPAYADVIAWERAFRGHDLATWSTLP